MKKNRSVYAGILCGVLVAALILSGLFVTTHLDHDCTGKNCSVCAMIFSCEQLIRQPYRGYRAAGRRCRGSACGSLCAAYGQYAGIRADTCRPEG